MTCAAVTFNCVQTSSFTLSETFHADDDITICLSQNHEKFALPLYCIYYRLGLKAGIPKRVMCNAVCSMRHAAKKYRVGVVPYVRFSVRCFVRYAMQDYESQHVAIGAACECEFYEEIPEMTSPALAFPIL